MRRKRRGERDHPYLRPLPGLKRRDVSPLINMEKEIEVM